MTALLVALGAALGAPLRWWVDREVQRRWTPVVPWGTLTVNVVGSFLLGTLAASLRPDSTLVVLVGVGFCGSLTTFSSFAWETSRLIEDGARLFAVVNVLASTVLSLGVACVGYLVAG